MLFLFDAVLGLLIFGTRLERANAGGSWRHTAHVCKWSEQLNFEI